jgi:hypothetical protein
MPATITKTNLPKSFDENLLPGGQLRCQIGSRVRLSEADRDILKSAYRSACEAEWESQNHGSPNSNQGIKVVSAWSTPKLTKALGMDGVLFSQLVNSRDAISLGIVLRIQAALGIEIISREYLQKVFEGYLKHITDNNAEP